MTRAHRRRRPRLLGPERRAQHVPRAPTSRWCCDLSAENRDRYAPQYPQARFTADFDDLLNDPALDAIAVASSVPTHHPLGLRALAAGKHVFIEKPLAASVADARELVDAAAERPTAG